VRRGGTLGIDTDTSHGLPPPPPPPRTDIQHIAVCITNTNRRSYYQHKQAQLVAALDTHTPAARPGVP